jgi:ABC-type sugar transport system permease subunit
MFILFSPACRACPAVVEAAQVDGATTRQVIRLVKLPLLAPCHLVAIILRMIDAFGVWRSCMLTFGGPGRKTEVLSLNIYKTA